MDGGSGGGGGGGGPAPFLVKTYEMVDDPATDKIVSWSSTMKSFVVWDSNEFSARLLPMYFKHSNFSSFIRQLNTYGFHKIDPERWEFANEDFVQGQKHLLKNIYRRKPIHSHSNPPSGGNADPERIALEEEIDRLNKDKSTLQSTLWKFKQQQSGRLAQLEDVEHRLANMEQRQLKMLTFLQQAAQNSCFVENLVKMAANSPVDLSAIHKRRRLPQGLICDQDSSENSFYGNHSSISKPELGRALDQEFCDRLKLGLCSSTPDDNLVTGSTQCSNEIAGSCQGKKNEFGGINKCIPLGLQALELSDTGASMCPTKNLLFPMDFDEGECHLRLTLASSTLNVVQSNQSDKTPNSSDEEATVRTEPSLDVACKETGLSINNKSATADHAEKPQEVPAVPTARANDLFWEQFLTERPGSSSDNEEASSDFRANSSDEQNEGRMPGNANL